LLKSYREAHENREGFMAGVSGSFAFFAVMSVIDLLKTDHEAHEDREDFCERGLGALRALRGMSVIESSKSYGN
jgi:hypothetical protein